MKLLELEIHNIRGIKEIKISPQGDNLVIWGPNGSGKSAVVDAIDFLLTGTISRLMGEGTAGITLKAHGPHIDHKAKEATVIAKVQVSGCESPIGLSRTMSAPGVLLYPPEHGHHVKPILDLAERGQHVLSRREILKYVAAEAGKRSTEVQALLNLSELEEIRKALGRSAGTARTEFNNADTSLRTAQSAIRTTLGWSVFELDMVRPAVDTLRESLGGSALTDLNSRTLKSGLVAPSAEARSPGINPQLLARVNTAVTRTLENLEETVVEPETQLRGLLDDLRQDEVALREVSRLRLLELGIEQIREDGSCPLCGTRWEPGTLRKHLESHIVSAKAANEKSEKVQSLARGIADIAASLRGDLNQLVSAATQLGLQEELSKLRQWLADINDLVEALAEPLAKYPAIIQRPAEVVRLFAPEDARSAGERIVNEAEARLPPVSPQQTAWDTLTRLEENLKQYESADLRYQAAKVFNERAKTLETCFEEARDNVLSSLYREIEGRFSELYRLVHNEDEPQFDGSLRAEGAALIFEVDFYGRGKFPPLALHSEGHQDTMGFCLYLALAERLTQSIIELTILDDVVMSVDSVHRRKICELLASQFPNRQFLITTHDRTWARQLTTAGVVPQRNAVEFTRWSVDTGPLVAMEAGEPSYWKKIQEDIDSSDIASASARLRRGGEQFFEQVCDNFRAPVPYRADGRWELGDFCSSGIAAYRKYLKEGKAAANSWGDKTAVDALQELESVAGQIMQRSQAEQWAINENLHYSRWGEYQPEDFRPVCEAWRDLLGLFRCSACGAMLFLVFQDKKPTAVRCRCGKVTWNLLRKEKTDAVKATAGGPPRVEVKEDAPAILEPTTTPDAPST